MLKFAVSGTFDFAALRKLLAQILYACMHMCMYFMCFVVGSGHKRAVNQNSNYVSIQPDLYSIINQNF